MAAATVALEQNVTLRPMSRKNWGEGSVYKRGDWWWISYPVPGRGQKREPARTKEEARARKLLRERLRSVAVTGNASPRYEKVCISELFDDLLRDYKINGKDKSGIEKGRIEVYLREKFGMIRAVALASSHIATYVDQRRSNGASNATVNRELSLLRSALKMASRAEPPKVLRVLHIAKLKENNIRKGFLEHEQFLKLMKHVPNDIEGIVRFAYMTGCRRGEIVNLRWDQFDAVEGIVRLNPGETKNDEARAIPLPGELKAFLLAAKADRDRYWPESPWMFSRAGQRILSFRGAWGTACKAAEMPNLLFHDFRRTGVRNLIRAGVSEKVAMAISGHKTRAIFDRYSIVSERDLKDAAKKLGEYLK